MYGRVYKYEEAGNKVYVALIFMTGSLQLISRTVCTSFGGLLMSLRGDARHVEGIELGMNLYLLMRKANQIGR